MKNQDLRNRAARAVGTFCLLGTFLLVACVDGQGVEARAAGVSGEATYALLVKDGRLARQAIADPLPAPVFASLPHWVAEPFDAGPGGAALYGVLTDEGIELWIQDREESPPFKLAMGVVSARFLPGARVAWLTGEGVLFVSDVARPVADEVASFGIGPDGALLLARDDRAGDRKGLWLLDADLNENLLSMEGLTGVWSSRYSPSLDPTGSRVVFLAGDANATTVFEIDLSNGAERPLSSQELPPIESMHRVGSEFLVLSGLGVNEEMDTELLLLEIRERPMPVRPVGDAVIIGSLGGLALVLSELDTEAPETVRRALIDLSAVEAIDTWEMAPVQALTAAPNVDNHGDSELGVLKQALGFYDVKYSRPLQGGRLTSFFSHGSNRFDCTCNGRSCRQGHRGTDIADPRGTPIFAAAAGSVGTHVRGCVEGNHSCGGGYGNYVRLVHGNGASSYYAHMTTVSKRSGSARCHENLGTVGNTGHSYGAHIHFEIRSSAGARLDPFVGRCNGTVNQSLWVNQGNVNPVFTCGSSSAAPAPSPDPAPSPSPAPSTGTTLQGIVHEAGNTSRRITGATVQVAGQRVTTNSTGYYSVRVSSGTHTATASASGYQTGSVTRTVSAGSQTWGSIGLSRQQATAPSSQGRLVGVAYEAPNSARRLSGASVRLSNGATANTNADGLFAFNVAPGTYTVTVSRSGFQTASVSRRVGSGETIWGSVGLRRQAARGTLKGVVYQNPHTNQRISGATVTLSSGQTATTGSNGAFSFEVAPGTYRITATKSGYTTSTVSRSVQSSAETWGSVGLSPVTSASGQLIGVIYVRPNTSERVPGARVWTSTGQSTVANSSGVYTLSGVPAGQVSIYAGAAGYSAGAVERTVRSGEQVWGSIGLGRASSSGAEGSGEGEGSGEDGFAFEGVLRAIEPINGELADSDPEFAWENLSSSTISPSSFSYRLVVINEDGSENFEADVEGAVGGETRTAVGLDLTPGDWYWIVLAISHDGAVLAATVLDDQERGIQTHFLVR